MTDLIPDHLQELRRIAVEITLGTYEWRIIETGLALLDCIEALEQELDAARAEAEWWKQRYEFLRSEMERLVQFADKMARRVLTEAGGGDQ